VSSIDVTSVTAPSGTTRPRRRNRRGEGSRLRGDILTAATQILEETGSEQAVTLRAIARRIGIAAPSIYDHFPDTEAILDQIVADGFAEFTAALRATIAPFSDPVERLLALGYAYLAYAAERPQSYRILFDHPNLHVHRSDIDAASRAQGAAALDVLVQAIAACVEAGRSTSTEPFTDALYLWMAMHGLATLLASTPDSFPWPDRHQTITDLAVRLARLQLEPGASQPGAG
jgi:AcrR family transcriptional regulator